MSLSNFTAATKIISTTYDKAIADCKSFASGSLSEDATITFKAKPSRYGISQKEFANNTAYSIGLIFTPEDHKGMEHVVAACIEATPQGFAFKNPFVGDYFYLKCKAEKDKFCFATNVKGLKPGDLSGSKKKKEIIFTGDLFMYIDLERNGTGLAFSPDRIDFK